MGIPVGEADLVLNLPIPPAQGQDALVKTSVKYVCSHPNPVQKLLALATAVALPIFSQQFGGIKPSFEVASVKPSAAGDIRTYGPRPGGRFIANSATLKTLIAVAWGVPEYQISGGPDWVGSDRWNIEGKAAEGSVPAGMERWPDPIIPDHPLPLMVQSLLEDRFQLKAHRETKLAQVSELMLTKAAKAGPNLKLSADQGPVDYGALPQLPQSGASPPRGSMRLNPGRGYLEGNGIPVAQLAHILSEQGVLSRPVIDKTELKGLWNFKLEWTPEAGLRTAVSEPPPPSADASKPSIFTAVQEQLGLKLESVKRPVEVLIVDRAEKPGGN
jgi:uncharacterized protein (TIGR03435 family)